MRLPTESHLAIPDSTFCLEAGRSWVTLLPHPRKPGGKSWNSESADGTLCPLPAAV